jgi:hypothetical protein
MPTKGGWTLSRQMVGVVIHSLLTDEELRIRFAINPMETLADLNLRGFDLTKDEIDVFVRSDVRMWFWRYDVFGDRVH